MATARSADEVNGHLFAQETQRLIQEPSKEKNSIQREGYQSFGASIDTSSLAGETDQYQQGNLIGPPRSNQTELLSELSFESQSTSQHKTTDLQCLMHILKGNIGTGVLAMPMAISKAGLWVGTSGVLFIGFVTTHCMHLLVKTSKIQAKRTGCDSLGYADVMEQSLKTGPEKCQRLAFLGRSFVNLLLLFTQFGFCSVYIVFIAESVKEVVAYSYPKNPGIRLYELGATALLIPFCLIRNLRTLAPFSLFANLLTVAGMVLIFINISEGPLQYETLPAFNNFSELPLFFGTAIFAFEGISLVLPLENSMQHKERFSGLAGILNLSMVTVTCLYTAVGFYGYIKFGSDIKDSITLNMPNSPWYYLIIKPMFAIAIFVSYNVQFYVPIRIIMPWLAKRLSLASGKKVLAEYLLRIFFVLITMGCAMAIPHLDLLISLIGALASSSLAIILPAIIHILTLVSESQPPNKIVIVKDILIILFGIIGFVIGTYTAMQKIVETF